MAEATTISIHDQPFSVKFEVPDYLCTRAARLLVNEKLVNKDDLKKKFSEANARLRVFHKVFLWIPLVLFVILFFVILWAGGAFKKRISLEGLRCDDQHYLTCRFDTEPCKLHSDCPNEQGCIWKAANCTQDLSTLGKSSWLSEVHDQLCTCETAMPWEILAATCAAYIVVFTALYFAYNFLLGYTVWGHTRMRRWVGHTLPLEATWDIAIDERDQCWTSARSTITFRGARMESRSRRHLYEQASFGKWVVIPSFLKGAGSSSGTARALRGAAEAAKQSVRDKNSIEPKPLPAGTGHTDVVFSNGNSNLNSGVPAGWNDPETVGEGGQLGNGTGTVYFGGGPST